ncbi:Non-structural maintenance of chromosomes element 1-like protein [Smittium mucronatum]|uniref:Non-structural maintenance of chromosomes element 1 homolog n=1 Tax=Smittium mucronatum TaxID=133383 RepID=A0A1R0GRN1_9FUNG|nr:Non-structural maintenance of chromosomes element 1-like protein [Smittium mucronatum]
MKSQLFLQQCLASKYFSDVEMKNTIIRIYGEDCNYKDILEKNTKKLEAFGLQIIKAVDQINGDSQYIICNIKHDSLTFLATTYSYSEITFLKILIDSIITAENNSFSISYHDAIRVSSLVGIPSFKQKDAQAALLAFQADKWLILSKDGKFLISDRTLTELHSYLVDIYPDELNNCYVCSAILTAGLVCHGCGKYIHLFCFKQLSSDHPVPQCLNCNEDYDFPSSYVGVFDRPFPPSSSQ